MEKILYIVRGLPGSGKSTFAETITPRYAICTADDYHMEDGIYNWKPENVSKAHEKCREKCEALMKAKTPKITVANTSTTAKEMKPYFDLAIAYGYAVFSIVVENRHKGVNTHNVPEVTLKNMRARFDIKL